MKSQNSRNQGFSYHFAWWRKLDPDPYLWLMDPDPGGPKRTDPVLDPDLQHWKTAYHSHSFSHFPFARSHSLRSFCWLLPPLPFFPSRFLLALQFLVFLGFVLFRFIYFFLLFLLCYPFLRLSPFFSFFLPFLILPLFRALSLPSLLFILVSLGSPLLGYLFSLVCCSFFSLPQFSFF